MRPISLLVLLAACSFAASTASAEGRRWIVGFKPGTSANSQVIALGASGLQEVDRIDELGIVIGQPKLGLMSPSLSSLNASGHVAMVMEDDYRIWINDDARPAAVLAAAPVWEGWNWEGGIRNVDSFIKKHLLPPSAFRTPTSDQKPKKVHPAETEEAPWGVRRVHAPDAWALGLGDGAGVKVAVIDTGIASKHPDLAGVVAGGYNARSGPDDAWQDDNGHGTHVSGTIAARKDGKGVVGVAPGVRLYAVKVLDKDGGGFLTDILKGIVWCAQNGIQVANMSLGSDRGIVFEQWAIEYAASRGVTIVAAAGNSGPGMMGLDSVGYPARYPQVIAVSALADTPADKPGITPWSSRGPEVAFIAPGENIYSTVPPDGYDWHDGTSMATPHVTGLAALAVAHGAKGPAAVRAMLKAAAVKLPGLNASEQGLGLIDARKIGR